MSELWLMLAAWAEAPSAERTLLALLLAGHLLGDFVFQTARMVEGKRHSIAFLLQHAGVVFVVHCALVLPFVAARTTAAATFALAALGLAHLLVDRWKVVVETRDQARGKGRRFRWWLVDQVLHLFCVLAAWRLTLALAAPDSFALSTPADWDEPLRTGALIVGVMAFNVHGGSAIVGAVLDACERQRPVGFAPPEVQSSEPRPWGMEGVSKASKGRVIGILERLILTLFVLYGAYGAIGFVLAGKSIARFKELEDRDFTEGYLVGTLASTLLAVLSGLALRAVI